MFIPGPRRFRIDEHAAPTTRQHLGALAGLLLGILLAPLPEAWRRPITTRLDIDVGQAAVPSSMIQLLACALAAGIAYAAWLHGLAHHLDEGAAKLGANGKYGQEDYSIIGSSALTMSGPLMPFVFVFTSPLGFTLVTAALGGLVRVMHVSLLRENLPDPSLCAIDWLVRRARRSIRTKRRELAKGGPSPDVLSFGRDGDAWDLCIVSPQDYPWTPGLTIVVAKDHYVLGSVREIHDAAGRVRKRYELKRPGVGAVIRGIRAYSPSMPPAFEDGT